MTRLQSDEAIEKQVQQYKEHTRAVHKVYAKKQRAKKGFCSRCGSINNTKNYKTCSKCRIKTSKQYLDKLFKLSQ